MSLLLGRRLAYSAVSGARFWFLYKIERFDVTLTGRIYCTLTRNLTTAQRGLASSFLGRELNYASISTADASTSRPPLGGLLEWDQHFRAHASRFQTLRGPVCVAC